MTDADERRDGALSRRAARARAFQSSSSRGQDSAVSSAHEEESDDKAGRELEEPIGSDIALREDEGQ